jgi:hypothetical protein
MVTAQDKPRSRLEEAPPWQCPRCTASMKVAKYPLPGRKFAVGLPLRRMRSRGPASCAVSSAKGWLQPSWQQRARRFLRP